MTVKGAKGAVEDEENLERRGIPRKGSVWPAKLETSRGTFECRVLNLTRRGAKIEIDRLAIAKEPVTLVMEPLGAFGGVVTWQKNGFIGIRITEYRLTSRRSRMALPGARTLP